MSSKGADFNSMRSVPTFYYFGSICTLRSLWSLCSLLSLNRGAAKPEKAEFTLRK